MSTLRLLHDGHVVATINTDSDLGKSYFRDVSPDAQFLSPKQFRVSCQGDSWVLEHIVGATNETLFDGKPVNSPVPLSSGMTIAVGNSAKGIAKFPLQVELIETETASKVMDRPTRHETSEPPSPPSLEPFAPPERETDVADELDALTFEPSPRVPSPPRTPEPAWNRAEIALAAVGTLVDVLGTSGTNHATVHEGRTSYGPIILTVKGNKVYRGNSTFNEVLATIDEQRIYRGNSTLFGEVLAHVDGNQVIKGSNTFFGDVIAHIDDNQVIEGGGMFGDVIATVENGGRMAAAAAAAYLLLM